MSKPVTIAGRMEKRCSRCRIVQAIVNFYVSRASGDGHGNQCKPCAKVVAKESAARNPDQRAAARKRWVANNPDKILANRIKNSAATVERVRKWRKENPDKFAAHAPSRLASTHKWRRANPGKIAEWNEANKPLLRSNVAKRRATRKNATPAWGDKDAIRSFYVSADALNMLTGEWHHVDHIVPLQSDIVCGLHNQFNLQILSAKENIVKSNRYWPNQP